MNYLRCLGTVYSFATRKKKHYEITDRVNFYVAAVSYPISTFQACNFRQGEYLYLLCCFQNNGGCIVASACLYKLEIEYTTTLKCILNVLPGGWIVAYACRWFSKLHMHCIIGVDALPLFIWFYLSVMNERSIYIYWELLSNACF